MNNDDILDAKSAELQAKIDRLSEQLDVPSVQVGLRTRDGLNIYVTENGSYHFTFYERGKLGFDQVGSLDDVLYWYCEGVVSSQAAKWVGDRAERFKYEYQVLSYFNVEWAKRNVRETAALFRDGQPEDIALLPDIGEAL
nr:immunity 63 family protein [Mycobacterium angelicum]